MFNNNQTNKSQRLNLPLSLERGRPANAVSGTLYSLSFLAVAGIAWASLSEIRELTSAPGQIMPIGQVNNVQHLEGGIVAEILVKEGATVKEGDPLIRLTPTSTSADNDQVKARAASLDMTIERLEASIQKRKPNFSAFKDSFPKLVEQQLALFTAEELSRTREMETVQSRIRQRQSDYTTIVKEEANVVELLNIQKEQLAIQEKLVKQGYTSKRVYLDVKTAHQRAESDLMTIHGKIISSREALNEAEASLNEMQATMGRKLADERSKATSEKAEFAGQIAKHGERYDRLMVRATSSGVVQELLPKVVGEVLRATEIAAKIVPAGQDLIAEVRLDPKDIGHVKVNDIAEVKFSTFDPAIYGFVKGHVISISPTTFLPATTQAPVPGQEGAMQNLPYYKAIVKLEKMTIGEGKYLRPLNSGMVATADIITGTKSLTRYMMKPVARSLDKAFAER